MAIVDSKGRLFGKVNILDIGAVLIILMVIIGVLLPSTPGITQTGSTKPVEFDVVARGIGIQSARGLFKEGDTVKIIIRNQPYGDVKVKSVKEIPRNVSTPQPDGSIKALPDPRPEAAFTRDFIVTLVGDAQITKDGPVLGNNKMKIGTKVELEGLIYDFSDMNVLDVRIQP